MSEAITTVDTGEKSRYVFRKLPGGGVAIETESRNASGFFPPTPVLDIDGKGATAVRRLAESHAELRRFFDAMRYLAEFDPHGRLVGFTQPRDCDTDELERARDLVAEIFEELEGLEL